MDGHSMTVTVIGLKMYTYIDALSVIKPNGRTIMKYLLVLLALLLLTACEDQNVFEAKAEVRAQRECKDHDGIHSVTWTEFQQVTIYCNDGTHHYFYSVEDTIGSDVAKFLGGNK